jgi:hypothetical protein
MDPNSLLVDALKGLLTELSVGPPGQSAYVLNPGDRGLLESLRALSAAQASARPQGRPSIASHVHHLRYGLSLINRWARGEDPYSDANWSESWRHQQVNDAEWPELVTGLAREIRNWQEAMALPRPQEGAALRETIGSIVHLAYHLGAIRQVHAAAAGPREQSG